MVTIRLVGGPGHGKEIQRRSEDLRAAVYFLERQPFSTDGVSVGMTGCATRNDKEHVYEVHGIHEGNPLQTTIFAFHESHYGQPHAQVLWEYAKQVKP